MPAAESAPVVSVVIGSLDRRPYLRDAIETVRAELARVPHELIVVDGGSSDGSVRWLVRQKDVLTIVQHNRGEWNGRPIERKSWGYFMNLGFRAARGRLVCMLSDDCLVVPGAIRNGIEVFDRALADDTKIGAVAFYFRDWPGEAQYRVGVTFGNRMFVNHGLYLKEALETVGYAREEPYRFYHADGDLSLRMWEAGYACVDSPDSYVEHSQHANPGARRSNMAVQRRDWDAYTAEWGHLGEPTRAWIKRDFSDPHDTAARHWLWRWRRARWLRRS